MTPATPAPCKCSIMCQDLGEEGGCRYKQPARETLRRLVDITYQHATEDEQVPATHTADLLIDRAFGVGSIPPSTPAPTDAGALADLAWQELINKDDRNSPEEYPEMALITREELSDFMSMQETRGDEPVAAALARRLCQLFDSGGESQRTVRARHASALFQILNVDAPAYRAEQKKCDADPVGYLEAAERLDRTSAPQQSPRLERGALKAAEQELTDLARPICCVYNRAIKKYEFTDAHIAQALPGTFEVIKQIRAALLSPDTTVVPSTSRWQLHDWKQDQAETSTLPRLPPAMSRCPIDGKECDCVRACIVSLQDRGAVE